MIVECFHKVLLPLRQNQKSYDAKYMYMYGIDKFALNNYGATLTPNVNQKECVGKLA